VCGIAGVALSDPSRPAPGDLAMRMAAALRHRGPDSRGAYSGPGIGLGVQRLAIVDLATGDQPIGNEDGSILVVCNGEIYNHVELRAWLETRGHRFRTASDVEVIVHLYEEEGVESVSRLRGMFAIALWDARQHRLWLARDRLGIKPLHYAETPGGLYFASEQKAILAAGVLPGALDVRALDEVFLFGFVLDPGTLFRGIRRLPPGHWLLYEGGRTVVRPYWRLAEVLSRGPRHERRAEDWAEALHAKLAETVALHVRADVRVGAWLSGGLDSSAVAALARRIVGPFPTFTLAFEAPAYDETRGQRLLAEIPGQELPNERVLCDASGLERYPEVLWHVETPSAYTPDLPRLLLAEAAARHVKVVLTGEGADEVFGGYAWHLADRLLHPVATLPLWLRKLLVVGRVSGGRWPWGRRLLLAPGAMDLPRYARLAGPIGGEDRRALFSADLRDQFAAAGHDGEEPASDPSTPPDRFAGLRYHDLLTRLAGYMTGSLDRTTMAFGLEARVPFLDHELVELASEIPAGFCLRGFREKYILRRAMAGDLPADIVWRRKRPLRAPVGAWLRERLPEFARALLSPDRLRADGYFDAAAVQALVARHRADPRSDGQLLWAVLGVQLWHELFRRPGGRWAVDGGRAPRQVRAAGRV
jgi:asparagine synthase (glutamine-hydrolysing)